MLGTLFTALNPYVAANERLWNISKKVSHFRKSMITKLTMNNLTLEIYYHKGLLFACTK